MGEDDKYKMNFPKFIMLIGLPGSGKSTWAEKYITENANTVLISSDNIRKQLFGDENSQEDNNRVFYEMEVRTLTHLNNGVNVIYDATNVVRKRRRTFLDKLPTWVIKEAHVIWAPLEVCIERDTLRDRTVGRAVIWRMVKSYQPPFFDEGFNRIYYNINSDFDIGNYINKITFMMKEPHDNPHHKYNIYEHCEKAAEYIVPFDRILKEATRWHDCGKPYVKDFHNNKGELTDIAHYYNHQNVGSYLIPGIFAHYDETYITPISWLVNVHMDPYQNSKYYNNLPQFLKEEVDILHIADECAH